MKKTIKSILILVLLGAAITWAFEVALAVEPLQGLGNCGEGFIYKDTSSPFEYNGDQNVCKVIVKAGSQNQEGACYGFKFPPASQTDGCYNVNGLGSSNVRVGGGGTSSECKNISHVEFYTCSVTNTPKPPTNTPTEKPDDTPTPTDTPQNTQTMTPTIGETPTPTVTGTPYEASPTPTETGTSVVPTPPDTLPPPPKNKTGTPPPILPVSGVDGRSLDTNGYGLFFAAIMLLIVLMLIFRAWLRSRK